MPIARSLHDPLLDRAPHDLLAEQWLADVRDVVLWVGDAVGERPAGVGDVEVAREERAVLDRIERPGLARPERFLRITAAGNLVPEFAVEIDRRGPGVNFDHLLDRERRREIRAPLEYPLPRSAHVVAEPQPEGHFVGAHAERAAQAVRHEQAEHRELEDAEAHLQRLGERLLRRIEDVAHILGLRWGGLLRGEFVDGGIAHGAVFSGNVTAAADGAARPAAGPGRPGRDRG
jgi:hypothetical protein